MLYLTLFNTAVCLYVLFRLQPYRLSLRVERSFWSKTPLTFGIWLMSANGYGRRIFNLKLRKAMKDDEDWHIHKLRHQALGCNVGVNCVEHTCQNQLGHKDITGAGLAWLERERVWNKENLKKAA
jgi:integrase